MIDWIDLLQKTIPLYGGVGALLLVLLVWEKLEHAKTRAALKQSQDLRVSEAMTLTTVVAGSNAASAARDASQGELSRSFQTLTATITQILAGVRR